MASDNLTAAKMTDWLRARGCTCGRNFANVGDLVKGIESDVKEPNETRSDLEARVKRIIKTTGYGFKSRSESEVSASEQKCG